MASLDSSKLAGSVVDIVGVVLKSLGHGSAASHVATAAPLIGTTIDIVENGGVDLGGLSLSIAATVSDILRNEGEGDAAMVVSLMIPVIQHMVSRFVSVEIRGDEIVGVIDFTE